MALVRVYGGLRVYFPTVDRAQADHPYAALIGLDNLLMLSQEYGGQQHFQLPKAERALLAVHNARIAADYASDKTAREIAAEHGLTGRPGGRDCGKSGSDSPTRAKAASLVLETSPTLF